MKKIVLTSLMVTSLFFLTSSFASILCPEFIVCTEDGKWSSCKASGKDADPKWRIFDSPIDKASKEKPFQFIAAANWQIQTEETKGGYCVYAMQDKNQEWHIGVVQRADIMGAWEDPASSYGCRKQDGKTRETCPFAPRLSMFIKN